MLWTKLKILSDRAKNYVSTLQFILIGIMFIEGHRDYLWAMIPLSFVLVVLTYYDYKYIFPQEYETMTNRNPFFIKMEKDIQEIKNILKDK